MSKQNDILNYVNTIVGATVSTTALCESCKCTLPTVLTFIKNNSSRFEKVKRGHYRVLAAMTNVTQQNIAPQYEW